MRSPVLAFLALPLALSAAACGRSNLGDDLSPGEGGGGAGGGTTSTGTTSTGTTSTGTTTTTVIPGACGDGVLQDGEQCDDGNGSSQDACLPDCTLAFCGDGFVHVGFEQCDDGNGNDEDSCVSCAVAFCGDGFVQAGFEQCDDGNMNDEDGCTSKCTLTTSVCGDGVLDPGEACDLGPMNADRPAFRLSWQMTTAPVVPVVAGGDAAIFYNYFSASGHTGFEQVDTSLLFLYASSSTKALSLFVEHGIDFTTTGQSQGMAQAVMDFTGLPATSVVALSDDTPGEFFKSAATSVHGDWSFQQNSDGGVISGLPFPGAWTISIQRTFSGALTSWRYQNGGKAPATIPITGTGATLQAFDTPSACRTTCTIPACGDGILDGGEVCDDGNTTPGDGCAADCKAF